MFFPKFSGKKNTCHDSWGTFQNNYFCVWKLALELGFRSGGSRKNWLLVLQCTTVRPTHVHGRSTICCWQPRANKAVLSLLVSSQHGNCEGSYSSYIISQQQYVVVHLHLAWFDAWFDWLSECTYVHNMGCRTHFVQNEWFNPCANDFTPGYTQSSTKWVAARFSLCASDWTHEYTILHKVSLS
jgi:hypothetical protein